LFVLSPGSCKAKQHAEHDADFSHEKRFSVNN
jgi:hypothetical protein